jgi:hypothetical protein
VQKKLVSKESMSALKRVWNATKKLEKLSRRLFMEGWLISNSGATREAAKLATVLEVLMLRRQTQP